MVVWNGDESSRRALELAARLAAAVSTPITVALVVDEPSREAATRDEVQKLFAAAGGAAPKLTVIASPQKLLPVAADPPASLVLVGIGSPGFDVTVVESLLRQLDCPVGLVR